MQPNYPVNYSKTLHARNFILLKIENDNYSKSVKLSKVFERSLVHVKKERIFQTTSSDDVQNLCVESQLIFKYSAALGSL